MLCKYKHIFGKEGEGIHSIRFFDIAIIDVLGTIIGSLLIARVFGWNLWWTMASAFALAIVMHRLFCVNTTINKAIFGTVVSKH